MSVRVDVQSTVRPPAGLKQAVRGAAEATLAHEGITTRASLSVMLADDSYLRRLNEQFRQEDRATDVLSFPAGDMPDDIEEMRGYLGDIAVSIPYAQLQATEKGHQLVGEIQLLVVHGVLHLLGYDHLTPEEKQAMWASQSAVLERLGISHVTPSEDEHDH